MKHAIFNHQKFSEAKQDKYFIIVFRENAKLVKGKTNLPVCDILTGKHTVFALSFKRYVLAVRVR